MIGAREILDWVLSYFQSFPTRLSDLKREEGFGDGRVILQLLEGNKLIWVLRSGSDEVISSSTYSLTEA